MNRFRFLAFSFLTLVTASLAAQTPFSFPLTSGGQCVAPEFGLSNQPKLGGAVTINGVPATDGDWVGVFSGGDLIGQGQVGDVFDGVGGTVKGILVTLQTNPQFASPGECPTFSNGDIISLRISTALGVFEDSGAPFAATASASGLIDGRDGDVSMTDVYDFDATVFAVDYTNLTATPAGTSVELNWATSSETDNSHFDVERSFNPAEGFITIGRVNGNGTTDRANSYRFVDKSAGEGTVYYRLNQFDLDGTATYSQIVTVAMEVSADLSVSIFPNPAVAGNRFTLRLNGEWAEGATQVRMTDLAGRQVAEWNALGNGSLNTELPVVQAGIYQLVATDGKERRVTRVVVR